MSSGDLPKTDPWPIFWSKLLVDANSFKSTLKKAAGIYFFLFYCHNCNGSKSKQEKKVTDWWSQIVCLMVWVSLGQLVDECHSLPCQGHYRANKAVPWKVYNNHWQEECCLFVMTHTHTHTDKHTYCTCTCTVHTRILTQTNAHTLSTFIQLKSISAPKLPFDISLVKQCICVSQSEVCVCTYCISICVCVWLCVWLCGCAAIIITLVNTHMSTYWSLYRWAMRDLRLQRAVWICLDFYWDHTARSAQLELKITSQGKIIGS